MNMDTEVPPFQPSDVDSFIGNPPRSVLESLEGFEGDILVLGAGGKMGLHLSMQLTEAMKQLGKKNKVVAVSRFKTLRSTEEFERYGIPVISCDLSEEEQLNALPDAALTFFLAGVKFGTSASPELLHQVNVLVPELVAKRFRDSSIVALSTGCVYPFVLTDSGGAVEETEPAPAGDYAVSCLGREKAFTDASAEYGTRCSLIRLNYSVEMRYGVVIDVAQKVFNNEPVDVTMGHFNAIWQGDAVARTILAHEHAASPPFILNLTGPETVSVRELAAEFGRIFNREPVVTGKEANTAWLSNAQKSIELFGNPEVSLEQVINWTAAWLSNDGETWGKPTNFERRDGKY